ncbi:MAG: hypothetical protein L0287_25850 [Anaerolineae bacterium]|nr:hypothetical protein [Anaerolineae bacterium]
MNNIRKAANTFRYRKTWTSMLLVIASCTSTNQPTQILAITGTPVLEVEVATPSNTNSPTSIPSATLVWKIPTVSKSELPTVIFEALTEALYVLDFNNSAYWAIDPRNEFASPLALYNSTSPAASTKINFAHYNNYFWFADQNSPQSFWVSDLTYINRWIIYTEGEPAEAVHWAPNDLFLIIESSSDSGNFIYDMRTTKLDPWPYACNQVALSPITNQYSLWCESLAQDGGYKILEWDGRISSSLSSPQDVLAHAIPNIAPSQIWSWSADGRKVAYFSLDDPNYPFRIADQHGNVIQTSLTIGGVHPWGEPFGWIDDDPIEWSKDGSRVLAFARGTNEYPCPPNDVDGGPFQGFYENPPCWHVVDAVSGKVVWRLSYFPGLNGLGNESSDFYEATISSNGRYLALAMIDGAIPGLIVVDIDTNSIILASPFSPSGVRWGDLP